MGSKVGRAVGYRYLLPKEVGEEVSGVVKSCRNAFGKNSKWEYKPKRCKCNSIN